MTGDPMQDPTEPRSRRMTLALAGAGVLVAGLLAVVFSFFPAGGKPWNVSVIGALALFTAARLGFWPALGFTAAALAVKDAVVYASTGMEPYLLSYVYFAGYAVIGWALLRRSESPVRIGATTLGASVLFYLVSNFVSWVEHALPYQDSLAGLLDSYIAGIPFFHGTLAGDIVFSATLFGAHAVLSRVYFPAERGAVEVEDRA